MNANTTLPSKPRQNPKTLALRFRAWQHVKDHRDNLTISELADAIEVPAPRLRRALRDEGWARILRSTSVDLRERDEDVGSEAFEADQAARDFVRLDA